MAVDNLNFIELVFGKNGWLVRNGYELNSVQYDYALAVSRSLTNGAGSVWPIEAETGVGKTLGYLFLLCFYASSKGHRVVIATHTLSLLSQLEAELSTIQKCFYDLDIPFPAYCSRLGRDNYVNPDKLQAIIENRITTSNRHELSFEEQCLLKWASVTVSTGNGLISGWIDEYGPYPEWLNVGAITCDSDTLSSVNPAMDANVELAKSCPMVLTSHAMLVNHCLTKCLGELDGAVVLLDEADKFEDAAELILNQRVQLQHLSLLISRHKGFFPQTKAKIWDVADKTIELTTNYVTTFDNSESVIYLNRLDSKAVEQISAYCTVLSGALSNLVEHPTNSDSPVELHAIQNELALCSGLIQEYTKSIYNRGIAFSDIKRMSSLFTKNPKPASIIKRLLAIDCTIVMTSATLSNSTQTQRHSFSYLASALLIKESAFRISESFSPVSFGTMDFVLSPKSVGTPYMNDGQINNRWLTHTSNLISFALESHERVLVLCNSYKELDNVGGKLQNCSRPIYLLDRGSSLREMIQKWECTGGALVAVNLWEGFSSRCADGGQLFSGLVITKLPFSPHDELDLQTLVQHYIQNGRDTRSGEGEYYRNLMTKSVKKFKQGIGRLIRRASDEGTLYIADSRFNLDDRKYKQFTDAIPVRFQRKLTTSAVQFIDGSCVNQTKTEWMEGLL